MTRGTLSTNTKGTLVRKEKTATGNKNATNDKAHIKGTYTVKIWNHPCTIMPPKSAFMRRGG